MDKNKKHSPQRNDFTAALSEELLSRKIFDKAKPKKKSEEEELFLDEFEGDLIAEPIDVSAKKVYSPPEKKTSKPKAAAEKKSSPPKTAPAPKTPAKETLPHVPDVEVKAESELEERIFAEADNDFLEEKESPESVEYVRTIFKKKKIPQRDTVFHSQYFKEQQEREEEDKNSKSKEKKPAEFDPELYRKLSRAELTGVALSAIMMVYSFATLDKALFFLAAALFTHLMRPLVGGFCGKYNRAVQNGMRSFSLALFFGAILFIFT